MPTRPAVLALLVLFISYSGVPEIIRDASSSADRILPFSAQARPRVTDLLDRLRGKRLPDGIVKTNGRIEATQVDVSAKYAGRLADIIVEEGSSVTQGQVIGRIDAPEIEAQLRAAQSNLERAKQSLAESEALFAQRAAVLANAKSDFERGQELVKKAIISQQTYDQRQRNYEGAQASLQGATAQK